MKPLLFTLLISISTYAQSSRNISLGMATYHLFGTSHPIADKFKDKWSRDGRLIGSPIAALELMNEGEGRYGTTKYFIGTNSMGGAMAGRVVSKGITSGNWYRGIMGGAYLQNASGFYLVGSSGGGIPLGGTLNLAPVIGFESMYKVNFMKWHLALTPTLAMTYMSWDI